MFIQSKIVTIFLIILHGCILVAVENCDRFQFSFDQNSKNISKNFTKQSFNKNGKPVYFSVFGPKKNWSYSVIWWNKETNNWSSQTKSKA